MVRTLWPLVQHAEPFLGKHRTAPRRRFFAFLRRRGRTQPNGLSTGRSRLSRHRKFRWTFYKDPRINSAISWTYFAVNAVALPTLACQHFDHHEFAAHLLPCPTCHARRLTDIVPRATHAPARTTPSPRAHHARLPPPPFFLPAIYRHSSDCEGFRARLPATAFPAIEMKTETGGWNSGSLSSLLLLSGAIIWAWSSITTGAHYGFSTAPSSFYQRSFSLPTSKIIWRDEDGEGSEGEVYTHRSCLLYAPSWYHYAILALRAPLPCLSEWACARFPSYEGMKNCNRRYHLN